MSTPGGTSCTRSTWPQTSSRTSRMCAEPTKTAPPRASTSAPHASSSGRPRIEYSSSEPCALTAYGAPLARPTAPPSRTWLQRTRSAGSVLAERRRVRLDPGVELLARAVLQQLDAVALVAVEHEDGKQAADVGTHDLRAAEVEALGVRLLAEDGDVVPGARPLARELAGVDVRARSRRAGTRARSGSSCQVTPCHSGGHAPSTPGGSRGRRAGRPRGSRCAR